MNERYYWIHIASGERGSSEWPAYETLINDRKKLELLNEWNRTAMIGNDRPTYHYWM